MRMLLRFVGFATDNQQQVEGSLVKLCLALSSEEIGVQEQR